MCLFSIYLQAAIGLGSTPHPCGLSDAVELSAACMPLFGYLVCQILALHAGRGLDSILHIAVDRQGKAVS